MNFEENTVRYAQISAALSRSRFRSRFRLGLKDRQYICEEYSACTGTHTQSVFGNLHKKQLAYTLSVVYNYKQGSNPVNKRPCDRQG